MNADVQRRMALALGYAWGYQDANGYHDSSAAHHFSEAYAMYAEAYYVDERSGGLKPPQDAYAAWTVTGRLTFTDSTDGYAHREITAVTERGTTRVIERPVTVPFI